MAWRAPGVASCRQAHCLPGTHEPSARERAQSRLVDPSEPADHAVEPADRRGVDGHPPRPLPRASPDAARDAGGPHGQLPGHAGLGSAPPVVGRLGRSGRHGAQARRLPEAVQHRAQRRGRARHDRREARAAPRRALGRRLGRQGHDRLALRRPAAVGQDRAAVRHPRGQVQDQAVGGRSQGRAPRAVRAGHRRARLLGVRVRDPGRHRRRAGRRARDRVRPLRRGAAAAGDDRAVPRRADAGLRRGDARPRRSGRADLGDRARDAARSARSAVPEHEVRPRRQARAPDQRADQRGHRPGRGRPRRRQGRGRRLRRAGGGPAADATGHRAARAGPAQLTAAHVTAVDARARDAAILASDDELVRACEVDRYRASGPGGQKRNKTESAVRVRHRATGVIAHADDSRSQHDNRVKAVRRLRGHLALELRAPLDLASYAPSPRLRALLDGGAARLGEKTRATAEFWAAIAELLDVAFACGVEVAATGARVGLGSGAVARFLTCDPQVLRTINQERAQRGLRPLR
ncbi:MAG: peptide chain release factor-like protein [Myxococcales bacterium]|nr:peptide chain release factor-like protein [Myxococcales bacterium]